MRVCVWGGNSWWMSLETVQHFSPYQRVVWYRAPSGLAVWRFRMFPETSRFSLPPLRGIRSNLLSVANLSSPSGSVSGPRVSNRWPCATGYSPVTSHDPIIEVFLSSSNDRPFLIVPPQTPHSALWLFLQPPPHSIIRDLVSSTHTITHYKYYTSTLWGSAVFFFS